MININKITDTDYNNHALIYICGKFSIRALENDPEANDYFILMIQRRDPSKSVKKYSNDMTKMLQDSGRFPCFQRFEEMGKQDNCQQARANSKKVGKYINP
jgi:hypothetical protein